MKINQHAGMFRYLLVLTINHIAAVVFPVLGGLVWMVDYRIVFLCGAGMSLISLMAVQKIKIPAG